jgi:NAD(P)-dependent dehydrogenase (short-subunit alcohol dehydrogenase family)
LGRLTDKNILITGGNSGIGLAAAQEFDREGARVAICGLNDGSLQAAKGTLGAGSLAIVDHPILPKCNTPSSLCDKVWSLVRGSMRRREFIRLSATE